MTTLIIFSIIAISSLIALFYMSNKFYKKYLALQAENKELKKKLKKLQRRVNRFK